MVLDIQQIRWVCKYINDIAIFIQILDTNQFLIEDEVHRIRSPIDN